MERIFVQKFVSEQVAVKISIGERFGLGYEASNQVFELTAKTTKHIEIEVFKGHRTSRSSQFVKQCFGLLHIHANRGITLPKVLKGAMELHDARIRGRGKGLLKSSPNTMRSGTINHKVQHINGKRGEEGTQNELVLLLPTKKGRANGRGSCSRSVKQVSWRARQGAVNKVKNTLTKEIWLHLHSPIKIIGVRKLQRNNLMSV